jgi:protein Tex
VSYFPTRDYYIAINLISELILQRTSVRISIMDAAIKSLIAKDVALPEVSVNAVVELFEKGNTVPFIARYRKEDTGGLDAMKVSAIQERLSYYKEVLDRRAALLKILEEQGKLTPELRLKIESCCSKVEIEDLHHQFRPKKKPRVTEALEKGLEPLAEYLWNQEPDAWTLETHADVFIDSAKKVESRDQALQGAINIIAEWISENSEYRAALRELLLKEGFVISTVVPAKAAQKTKYNMYYNRREAVSSIPSHRVLAIRRGSKEGILTSSIEGDVSKALEFLSNSIIRDKESVFAPILEAAIRESHHYILRPLIETEVRAQLKERADRDAIRVFQENLANLLMSPPAGPMVVMGVDTSKSGDSRLVVIDEKGSLLEEASIRFSPPKPVPPAKVGRSADVPPQASESTPEAGPAAQETEAETAIQADGQSASSDAPEISSETLVEPPSLNEEPAEVASESPEMAIVEVENEAESPLPEAETEVLAQSPIEPSSQESDVQEIPVEEPIAEAVASESASESAVESAEPVVSEFIQPAQAEDTVAAVPEKDWSQHAQDTMRALIDKHSVRAIAIGIGARDVESALRKILKEEQLDNVIIASVSDAGIAIYSSSRVAREEFPNLSATTRCAISLARRLQDPLSELVKIDPKLIGVGQYQHDVDQKDLHRSLLHTVQTCVNSVGVDLHSANQSLLRYIAGLNDKLARKIIAYRHANGPFASRAALLSGLGMDRSIYDQAAGFLRVRNGENPLDHTRIHPESYPVVEKMAAALGVEIANLIGNKDLIATLKLEDFAGDARGLPTLHDIREELRRPGVDSRKPFIAPRFRADINDLIDLKVGMVLEGTITNVTNFGAFVDVGVHQDGLVHLSQMSNRFIRDPREAVKVSDVVQIKVISVEVDTRRIGLSMKAVLPPLSRRRRKPQRKPKLQGGASIPGKEPSNQASADVAAAGTSPSAQPATEKPDAPSPQRQNRAGSGPRPPRRRNEHRREKSVRPASAAPKPTQPEPANVEPEQPEHTLQEKIAILQSKFRGSR